MKSTKWFLAILVVLTVLHAAAASAARVDMNDPRRALGREDDVRVDAQLQHDEVAPGANIGVTYQIQNLTTEPIAIADKVSDVSYDPETRTITLSIGSEVPPNGVMPHLVTIGPGETKTFHSGGVLRIQVSNVRGPFAQTPRFVQIKVNVLRDVASFANAVEKKELGDALFSRFIESNQAIFLNTLPVRFSPRGGNGGADASRREATGM